MQSNKREEYIIELKKSKYDILVIGGGVTGAGIALDATSRGLKTALIEMKDFASGTSSRSTKLIHGGLRYLKQLDFGLVHETGTERAVLHRLAPHMVIPEKMILPLIHGGTYGKLATSFGLKVYDILAGVSGEDRRKMLSKEETLKLEPLLNKEILKGSGFYAEYRTDDARLTIELIKTANRYGAQSLNYIKAVDFQYLDDKIVGVVCEDQLGDHRFSVFASQVVVAGGPWVDELRTVDRPKTSKRIHHTKGVHIVVPREKFPLSHTVYYDGPDGRMMFAIPRGRITYIGTTDTDYRGDLNRIVATQADLKYILNSLSLAFPAVKLNSEDVISNWAGVRPLIHEEGKSPSELSRKDEIFESSTGLIAIAGGKLTGYRKMAERVVDKVAHRLSQKIKSKIKSVQTKKIPLIEKVLHQKEINELIEALEIKIESYQLDPYFSWYLVTNYGHAAQEILDSMIHFKNSPEISLTRAELAHCLEKELVFTLEDFYVRRTGRLYFEIGNIAITKEFIIEDFANYFDWTAAERAKKVAAFDIEYQDATTFYDQEFSIT